MRGDNPNAARAMVAFCYTGSCERQLGPPYTRHVDSQAAYANFVRLWAVRVIALKYGVKALSAYAPVAKFLDPDQYFVWHTQVLGFIDSNIDSADRVHREVCLAMFREVAAIATADCSIQKFQMTIQMSHFVLSRLVWQLVWDDEYKKTPWGWTCSKCETTFEYDGEQKSEKDPTAMVCPWCAA